MTGAVAQDNGTFAGHHVSIVVGPEELLIEPYSLHIEADEDFKLGVIRPWPFVAGHWDGRGALVQR